MGDPAGIGPDVVLMAWAQRQEHALPAFFVCGDPDLYRKRTDALGLDVPVQMIETPEQAMTGFEQALPVIDLAAKATSECGKPAADDASLVLQSLDQAISYCVQGEASALVTAPINKAVLYSAGFDHQGHEIASGEPQQQRLGRQDARQPGRKHEQGEHHET